MMLREVFRYGSTVLSLLALAACTSSPRAPAPVETRGASPKVSAQATVTAPAAETVKAMPGTENAGKPGFYTVQRGDTLTRIALDHGHSWRDLASWNSLPNAHLIEVGQVLRVVPPNATRGGAADWGQCRSGHSSQASYSTHTGNVCQRRGSGLCLARQRQRDRWL